MQRHATFDSLNNRMHAAGCTKAKPEFI